MALTPLRRLGVPLLALASGLGAAPARAVTPEQSELSRREYETIFPCYIEVCAHTQLRTKPGAGRAITGNRYGHGGLYLHGACLDLAKGFPQLRLCDASDRDGGAGVSTDYTYQSVSWVASSDRHFFYWGDLRSGERFTRAREAAVQQQFQATGILRGIEPSKAALKAKPKNQAVEPFLLEENFGTDYAINLARSSACLRIPLEREMLVAIIDFLNHLNVIAHESGNPFSGLANNCAHTWHNALAAIDFWPPLRTNRTFPLDLFELAIPFNQLAAAVQRATRLPLEDPAALFRDRPARAMFDRFGTFPAAPGVVLELHEAFPDNDIFDTSPSPHFLDWAGLGGARKSFAASLREPALIELRLQLTAFRERLLAVRAGRASRRPAPPDPGYQAFLERYDRWADSELGRVDSLLHNLQ